MKLRDKHLQVRSKSLVKPLPQPPTHQQAITIYPHGSNIQNPSKAKRPNPSNNTNNKNPLIINPTHTSSKSPPMTPHPKTTVVKEPKKPSTTSWTLRRILMVLTKWLGIMWVRWGRERLRKRLGRRSPERRWRSNRERNMGRVLISGVMMIIMRMGSGEGFKKWITQNV